MNLNDSDDPARPSLPAIIEAGHALSIPWAREVKTLMAGLDARCLLKKADPWKMSCPFDVTDFRTATLIPDTGGGICSYSEALSSKAASSTEHLSAALGLTVGYPFLNAGVSIQYDETVTKNDKAIRASRNASCRLGRIIVEETPHLSDTAMHVLRVNGPDAFQQTYGDFYVCGYELGADAGAQMSATNETSRSDKTITLTVTVKVLFFSASVSHTETMRSETSGSTFTFTGYNSLHATVAEVTTEDLTAAKMDILRQNSSENLRQVACLESEARDAMSRLPLKDGHFLSLSESAAICKSGLVVQLLLAPFKRLNQFVDCLHSNTIYLQIQDLPEEDAGLQEETQVEASMKS